MRCGSTIHTSIISFSRQRVFLLALALGMATPLPASAEVIGFGKASRGAPPLDFDFSRTGSGGSGRWAVVDDDTADGGRALEQSSTEKTDYRFPLAIYKPLSAKNVEATVRFKPIAGEVDRAGGIAVRLSNPDNYYLVRANALEDNVRFYRIVKGRRIELKSADAKVAANAWHTLALKAEGDRFTVTFDGKQLYTVTDKTFGQAGRVALWTKADSVTRFDRLEITPHDR